MFPNPILQQIFAYLSLPDRIRASRVSHKWYYNGMDPHLYQDIEFENLEFYTLIQAMKCIVNISPLIRSIRIEGCYSEFIRNTVIPVQFSTQSNQPLLFSHIKALHSDRRRQEYLKHGFELFTIFSDIFTQILKLNRSTLNSIKINHCDLDIEMTELFCAIACHGQSLETFHYTNNGDKGLYSSGLLKAIVSGCPRMRHFIGLHAGMNDAVVMMIARHWPHLKSLTLCSIKTKNVSGLTGFINEDSHEFRSVSPTGAISSRVFWELLKKCKQITSLEAHDLSCITNRDLAQYLSCCQQKQQHSKNVQRFQPYKQQVDDVLLPGSSILNLKVNKYITTPLSTPGFHDLVQLFPNLTYFEYATNFYTFNNQFEGITLDMFNAEREAVAHFMNSHQNQFVYKGLWNEPITTEQRLMAGMATRSEQ